MQKQDAQHKFLQDRSGQPLLEYGGHLFTEGLFVLHPFSLRVGLSLSYGARLSLFKLSGMGGMLWLHMGSHGCIGDV